MDLLFAALFAVSITPAQKPRIDELVRQTPGPTVILDTSYDTPPTDLRTLVARAGVIVVGYVTGAETKISPDHSEIFTDAILQVEQVAKGSLNPGDRVVVRKRDGTLTVLGKHVQAVESDFPPLLPGEKYALFLQQKPGTSDVYQVYASSQGAFRVDDGLASPVSRGDPLANGRAKVSLGQLVQMVKSEIERR